MTKIEGLDDWIMGINDPKAPFNQPDEEAIEAMVEAEYPDKWSIIEALNLDKGDLEEFAELQFDDRPWEGYIEHMPGVEEQMRDFYYDELVETLEL